MLCETQQGGTFRKLLPNNDSSGLQNEQNSLDQLYGLALIVVIVLSFLLNLILLVSATIACSICNRKHGRTCLADQLIRIIAAICLLQTASKTLIQVINLVNESSNSGYAACQFQGLMGSLFKYFLVGCVSLLVLDRWTKSTHPYEYPLTFTHLNAWIVLPGMVILILAQVTGPVYGWGAFIFDCEVYHCTLDPYARSGCSYQILADMWLLVPHVIAMINVAIRITPKCFGRFVCSNQPDKTDAEKRQLTTWSNRQGLESVLLSGQYEQHTVLCLIIVMIPLFVAVSLSDVLQACSKRRVSMLLIKIYDLIANTTHFVPALIIVVFNETPLSLLRKSISCLYRTTLLSEEQTVRTTSSTIELGAIGRRSCGLDRCNSNSMHSARSTLLNL